MARPRLQLDLPKLSERLRANGIAVVDARVMLIVQLGREVTVSRDGRILIKTKDPAEADRLFAEVCDKLDLPREAPAA
ncbi:MAG TPA: hypothetical protein VGV89_05290 [Thermoplasmata archaeon]|nr:hypothetical protein [Thermoplasmata archaeon]